MRTCAVTHEVTRDEGGDRVGDDGRERYQDLFEVLPFACIVTDLAGVIHAANGAAGRLLGAPPRKLKGRPILALAESRDTRRVRELIERIEATAEIELRVQRVRGAPFDGVVTCARVDRGGRLLFVVRAAELPRRDDQNVAALSRALRDKEELLAREHALRAQLEKSDHAKDRFIAVLSHDLRGPINAVLGWTQLLRKEFLPKDARDRALATIERSSRAQLALVEELLDLSRITADKMGLELVPIELGLTVRRFVEALGPAAADAGVEIESDIADDPLIPVFADRNRLGQIVSNLVSNALKFTPAGGRVRVRVHRDGPHALVEVADTGQGIEPELMPQLFDCYRQGAAPAAARPGLGLGLYIVRQLVELHGGTVEASSDGRHKGSRFVVRLPLREIAPSVASERHLPDDDSPSDLDGVRVLVVEDEPDSRELLTAVLSGKGASVSAACDATQALAMFDSCHPDVIVSDIGLPGEDGCALIRRLRSQAGDVHAVAVSGFAAPTDAARALEAGFYVHVAKPIEPGKLVLTVRDLARRAAQ